MSLQILQELDEDRWRAFVNDHPQGNIFHTPEMFQVFKRAEGFHPELRAAVDGSGRILALLLPVFVYLHKSVRLSATTRIISHGSVLCAPDEAGLKALDALLATYSREGEKKALCTELRNLNDLTHLQPVLNANGFAYEDHLNYLIDINRPPEAVMQGFGPRTRKHIRHALRTGDVTVEEVQERDLIPTIHQLFSKSYASAAVPLAHVSLFEAAYDLLKPRGMIKFLLARVDNNCVAATAELPYKDVIYGWYSGIDRAFGSLMAGELLMWHILKWGAESGYRVYDFGGAGKPGEPYAVREFKAKFGGDLVCFGRNKKVHAPVLLACCELGYRLYRNLRSRRSPYLEKRTS